MQTENVGSERQGKPDSAATIHMYDTYIYDQQQQQQYTAHERTK